jgi:hypothetical protein
VSAKLWISITIRRTGVLELLRADDSLSRAARDVAQQRVALMNKLQQIGKK